MRCPHAGREKRTSIKMNPASAFANQLACMLLKSWHQGPFRTLREKSGKNQVNKGEEILTGKVKCGAQKRHVKSARQVGPCAYRS